MSADALALRLPAPAILMLPPRVGMSVIVRSTLLAITGVLAGLLQANHQGEMLRRDGAMHPEVLLAVM